MPQRDTLARSLSNQYALQQYQPASPLPVEVREASPGEPARNPHAGAPRTPRPAISIRGLTKRYGPLTALNDLNLDIQPGEVFGFLGLNGAGKPLQVENLLVLWAIAATGYALAYLVISQRDIAR